jgi:Acetyltransferase (GNAT) domain
VRSERYHAGAKGEWDGFLPACRNATFLHRRDYVEYHGDRFVDHSLLFRNAAGLVALLPANAADGVLHSHGGLTYGGLLYDDSMTLARMLDLVECLRETLRAERFRLLRYRPAPHVYHRWPAAEDLFALSLAGANLVQRAALALLAPASRSTPQSRRSRGARRARRTGVEVRESSDLEAYWRLLSAVLDRRYGARPVHALEEIERLRRLFPENIRLFCATADDELLAGILVYETDRVARLQYIAASERGRETGALDLIVLHLLDTTYAEKAWIDFGTSEGPGRGGFNEGVLEFKESWGARAVLLDTYELGAVPPKGRSQKISAARGAHRPT